jgi:hypothetical protein
VRSLLGGLKKLKLTPSQSHEDGLRELSDEDRATLQAMAARYGFRDDIAEFAAEPMMMTFGDEPI